MTAAGRFLLGTWIPFPIRLLLTVLTLSSWIALGVNTLGAGDLARTERLTYANVQARVAAIQRGEPVPADVAGDDELWHDIRIADDRRSVTLQQEWYSRGTFDTEIHIDGDGMITCEDEELRVCKASMFTPAEMRDQRASLLRVLGPLSALATLWLLANLVVFAVGYRRIGRPRLA